MKRAADGMGARRRRWLVTGSASGLGRALCRHALASGDTVICAARSLEQNADLAGEFPDRALPIRLDLADAGSFAAAAGHFDDLDILVNCAGRSTMAVAEEIGADEAHALMEVNFFGQFHAVRAALPGMRARRAGVIVNVSSIAGFVGLPGLALYSASKFAVEGFSEALAREVEPFGIRVHLVEPGPFRTGFRARSMHAAPRLADYAESFGPAFERMAESDGRQSGDPDAAARIIYELATETNGPFRLPLGGEAFDALERKLAAVAAGMSGCERIARTADYNGTQGAEMALFNTGGEIR